jgi:hypothetical protein
MVLFGYNQVDNFRCTVNLFRRWCLFHLRYWTNTLCLCLGSCVWYIVPCAWGGLFVLWRLGALQPGLCIEGLFLLRRWPSLAGSHFLCWGVAFHHRVFIYRTSPLRPCRHDLGKGAGTRQWRSCCWRSRYSARVIHMCTICSDRLLICIATLRTKKYLPITVCSSQRIPIVMAVDETFARPMASSLHCVATKHKKQRTNANKILWIDDSVSSPFGNQLLSNQELEPKWIQILQIRCTTTLGCEPGGLATSPLFADGNRKTTTKTYVPGT